ncbi:MAG: TetR/AcrR family transcriptional regulator [Clostridia bacterium]|nr:TetR/AcrR family transcriptional regulator [Clostridia bacterium]
MPTKIRISKDMILDAAFEIVRQDGIEKLSNRELAKKLKCSIRPIYYQFENVEEMQKELYVKIEKYFYKFLLDNMVEGIPQYKQVGINYIRFAKKEKKLFQTLFMSEMDLTPDAFVSKAGDDYKEIEKLIKISTNLKEDDIKDFHTKMWIFCHGMATLVASNTVNLTDEQIQQLLSYEFQALMLLEENPNNKWVLPKGDYKMEKGEKKND